METNIGDLVRDGNIEELTLVLDNNPNDTEMRAGRFGVTPFLRACLEGQIPVIKLLVDRNCSIQAVDNDKFNGAHLAAYYGHREVLEYLYSIDPSLLNQTNRRENTPLLTAFNKGYLDIVDYLLDKTDLSKSGGKTLVVFARSGHLTGVKFLLDKGVPIHLSLLRLDIDEDCKRMICYYHLWHRIKGYCFAHTYDPFIRKLPGVLTNEIITYL